MFQPSLLRIILRQLKNVFTNNSKINTRNTAGFTQNSYTGKYQKEDNGSLAILSKNFVRLNQQAKIKLDIFDEFATIKEHNNTYYLGIISDLTEVYAYPILEKEYFWVQETRQLTPGIYNIYDAVNSEGDQYFELKKIYGFKN
jgi:hypothetical protein